MIGNLRIERYQIQEEIGDRRLAILSGGYFAITLADLGEDQASLDEYTHWAPEADEIGEINLIYSCVLGPLELYLIREDWDKANDLFDDVFDRPEETENRSGKLNIEPDRAAAYLGGGDLDRAQEIANRALSHTQEANAPVHIAKSLRVLAGIEGHPGQIDEAEAIFSTALKIFQDIGSPLEEGRMLEQRGKIRIQHGFEVDGRADLAAAIAIYQASGAVTDDSRIYSFLSGLSHG